MNIKLNDDVRYIGRESRQHITNQDVGSVILIYDDILTEYGSPVTHLVRFDFDGDLERELVWFNPNDLQVVTD